MEIVFESTEDFNRSLARFSGPEQSIITDEVEGWVPLLLTEKGFRERRLHQFCQFNLRNNYGSSLYSFIVNYYLRVILTIDEDPLCDRLLVTLFDVVESREAAVAYKRVGDSIYRTLIETSLSPKSSGRVDYDITGSPIG